jgi:alkyl hydroperoxide reductase subunit AhpC
MVTVGSQAPMFDGRSVVEGNVVDLTWSQIHQNKTLVLLFDSVLTSSGVLDEVASLDDCLREFSHLNANVFLVCRDPLFEIVTSSIAIPVIVDSDNRLAALYDLLFEDGRTLWGQCIIDGYGIVRKSSECDAPAGLTLGDLIRYVKAIGRSDSGGTTRAAANHNN